MDIAQLHHIFLQHPEACTDTRKIVKGAIFFALKGDNFNANAFAEKALEEGCAYAVIDEAAYKKNDRYILVNDVLKCLQELAHHHRKQFNIPVIGITGSNGKTTSKELIYAVLQRKYNTLATVGNLNNHIGVPLTLLKLNAEHQMAIIEMGANHQGEIDMLSCIAAPGFGMITNIGKAHLEGFGGIEGVKKGKSELYRFITKNKGKLFVNADDEVLMNLSEGTERILYGTKGNEFLNGEIISANPFVTIKINGEIIPTQLVGTYNLPNLLAAACIGKYFNVSSKEISEALSQYLPSNSRSQVITKGSNTIIMDAYNANPSSMSLAIDNFAELKAEKKLAILGDMLELGTESDKEHAEILKKAFSKNFDGLLLVGKNFMGCSDSPKALVFADTAKATNWLRQNAPADAHILIKGSRGIRLEGLLDAL